MKDGSLCKGLHCRCMYPEHCGNFHHSDHDCPHDKSHNPEHICTTECVCPDHRTQLLFNRESGDHACQDITCIYAHGVQAVNLVIRREVKERLDRDPRGPFESPGAPFNLVALRQLLYGWACCGNPAMCGASCQESELADTLARAFKLVEKEIVDKYGQETLDKVKGMMGA